MAGCFRFAVGLTLGTPFARELPGTKSDMTTRKQPRGSHPGQHIRLLYIKKPV